MPRVISVFLPTLSTDRVRRKAGDTAPPPETPLILVGRRRVILAADATAQAAGLRIGMPASKAQALVQGLVIQDADPSWSGWLCGRSTGRDRYRLHRR
jgi:protein ImuB